jgi:ankyrin repeat protein
MKTVEQVPGFFSLQQLILTGNPAMAATIMKQPNGYMQMDKRAMLLRTALAVSDEETVAFLLENDHYCTMLMTKADHGWTPLHKAVANSSLECVTQVCEAGIKTFGARKFMNGKDSLGNTPYFLAFYRLIIATDIVPFILALRTSNCAGDDHVVPRHISRQADHLETGTAEDAKRLIQFLISQGANPQMKNLSNQTADLWSSMQSSVVTLKIKAQESPSTLSSSASKEVCYWPAYSKSSTTLQSDDKLLESGTGIALLPAPEDDDQPDDRGQTL